MFTRKNYADIPGEVKASINATVNTLKSKAGNPVRTTGAKLLVGQRFTIYMPMADGQTVGDAFQALLTEHPGEYAYTGIQTVEGRELSLAQLIKPGSGLFKMGANTAEEGAALLMGALYDADDHTIRIEFHKEIPILGRKAGEQYSIRDWRFA